MSAFAHPPLRRRKQRGALQEKDKREVAAERQLHYGSWPGLQTPNSRVT
jgi:hypothetical protein